MALKYNQIKNSYVVFTKVSSEIWNQLPNSQKLTNTLYFVIDGNSDDVGQLYLGPTLIADGSGITDVALKELEGVKINAVQGEDVLMYNMETQKWENTNLPSYLGTIIKDFVGAQEGQDGTNGLVPAPTSNDINLFLQGNGTWADPNAAVREDLAGLQATITTIVGTDTNKSMRTIATDEAIKAADAAVARVVAQAPDSFDTLKEIADWIQAHPDVADIATMQTKVQSLDEAVFNEETGLAALNTKVGSLSQKVSSLETQAQGFVTQIGDLDAGLKALQESVNTNTTNIEEILERLVWQELVNEEEE